MRQKSYTLKQNAAWYKTIARNAAIRANRKHTRWMKELLTLNAINDQGDEIGELFPSESAERAFRDSELLMVLETLPDRERLIIEAIYERGDTQREIAGVLHVSQSEVCQLHKKALKRIRRAMEK